MKYWLNDIRTQHSNPADCMKNLIRRLLRKEHLWTWNHIILALKSPKIGESQLADTLKEKYCPGEFLDTYTTA